MDVRHDTLLSVSKMIVAINEAALVTPGGLASVAVINSTPQSINTLASRVQFSIDIRGRSDAILAELENKVTNACEAIANGSGVKIEKWDKFWTSPQVIFDETMVRMVRESAKDSGFSFREIQSGAGHDS